MTDGNRDSNTFPDIDIIQREENPTLSFLNDKSKAVTAEFLATALFVYIGCGSVISAPDRLTIALAFGLSLTMLIYTFGHHSGGHINPIVTIAMMIWGEMELQLGVAFILAQLVGSIFGAALLMGTASSVATNPLALAVNQVNPGSNIGAAFLMEVVLSFLLVHVIGETVVNKKSGARNIAPIAIGFSVVVAHIVAIPFTGTSINPARSFGPAIVSATLTDLWLFFLAPITGGVMAALSSYYFFGIKDVLIGNQSESMIIKLETPQFT